MKQKMIAAPQSETAQAATPVCRTAPLRRLGNADRRELAWCPLPEQDSAEILRAAFLAAPQFSQIPLDKLMESRTNGRFRLLLLGENDYYLRQAAAYLTALSRKAHPAPAPAADSFWDDLDLGYYQSEEPEPEEVLKNALAVLSPTLLDPAMVLGGLGKPAAATQSGGEVHQVDLRGVDSAGLLIAAPTGTVLSEAVIAKVDAFLDKENTQDLFIALKSSQTELELLEELRFTHGFEVCRVGQADQGYLKRLFTQCARELLLPLAPGLDVDRVIAQLRRYRGRAFEESDLCQLLHRAARRSGKRPLETADLMLRPCRAQGNQGREGLQNMVGLGSVKDALNRILATAALEDRRRLGGAEIPPSCRNLAFSGPPGTGKSVTARLAAQILREEGCGTGRFVEAGREQLIGPYLGQTSPMIAELFRKARGGVLFIDEAGALLDSDGHDSYAAEAVNALVRHMELEPETMVIFATYPEEMKKLLASNPGLSSRVAQVLDFPGYSDEDLLAILRTFARKEQLALPAGADAVCASFFRTLRGRRGDRFGNGREVRRFFQAAKEELALRSLNAPETEIVLTTADLENAARRLLAQEQEKPTAAIGFHA